MVENSEDILATLCVETRRVAVRSTDWLGALTAMLWKVVSYLTLIGEAIMLVLAIRLVLIRRTRTFTLLMWACVCFVIARSSWFTFGLLEGLLSSEATRAAVNRWHEYTNFTFQLSFVVLMIATLISFIRERTDLRS
jgi:hypothetical protein